ncbi:hypothetical protein ACFYOV_28905 [Streptomyces sp. NPDC005931]
MTEHLWLDLVVTVAQILLLLAQTVTQWWALREQARRSRTLNPCETGLDD